MAFHSPSPTGNKIPVSNQVEVSSQAAGQIVRIYDQDTTGQNFFDSVTNSFKCFDTTRQYRSDTPLSNDISLICQSTIASLTTSQQFLKIQDRIDAYFYILRRIEEYETTIRQSFYQRFIGYGKTKQLKQAFHDCLGAIFVLTKGSKPNLHTTDKNLLKKMNIREHLIDITMIDNKDTLHTFLVLCKLSFQASLIIDNSPYRLQWVDLVSKLRSSQLTLTQIVAEYNDLKVAFDEFSLDIPAFIQFIMIKHPSPHILQNSPFLVMLNLVRSLNLSQEIFYEKFEPVFAMGVQQKIYISVHINDLLQKLSSRHTLFDSYLSIYSSRASDDELWNTFSYLCENIDLNEMIQKPLIENLTNHFSKCYSDKFYEYIQSAAKNLTKIKPEYRSNYVKTLEAIIHAFIDKKCNDKFSSSSLTEQKSKLLLQPICGLSPTPDFQNPPNSLIIERLLFKTDVHNSTKVEKLNVLFRKLNGFTQNLCEINDPALIIRDEWLTDYVLSVPQEWSLLKLNFYQHLCNNHQDNRWGIYVWSRITYLGLLKVDSDNTNNALLYLDQWLINVKQTINNRLSIIFICNLFNTIIIKYKNSILLLPNIEYTFDCIFDIHEKDNSLIDTKQMNQFIENGIQLISDIHLLEGNSILIVLFS
jgi:hypothetical protein